MKHHGQRKLKSRQRQNIDVHVVNPPPPVERQTYLYLSLTRKAIRLCGVARQEGASLYQRHGGKSLILRDGKARTSLTLAVASEFHYSAHPRMMDTLQPWRRQFLAWILALAVGTLGLWLEHRHQFSSNFDQFPGPRGDTRLIAYLCEHGYQALRGKADWLSPAMFFPSQGTLGYTDALLLFIPPHALLRMASLDIFTALAFTIVIFNFLNFIAGFALLFNALRFRWLPSVAGALFFAFNNPKLAQPDHPQLQPVWPLAVIAACVIIFLRDAPSLKPRRAFGLLVLAGLALNVQLLTAFYLGWFLIFWSAIFVALAICLRRTREVIMVALRRHWRAMLGAALVAVAGLVPFLIVYLPAAREVGGWSYGLALRYIPELRSYLLTADSNFIWGHATKEILQAAGGDPDWGQRVGIGLIPTVAWLGLSILAVKRRGQHPFFALAVLSVNLLALLALQYHGHSLWHVVHKIVPGAQGIRAVSRFMIVVALPMSAIFAFAIERAQDWAGKRAGLCAALIALIAFGVFEQFNSGAGDFYSIRAENARLQRLAAKLPGDCAAFYVTAHWPVDAPMDSFQNQQWMHDAMLISVMRGVPTLNGRSGRSPPGWELREVTAPDYEQKVRVWIARHNIGGKICSLDVGD
jgi:hypothetical protein